MVAAGCMVLYGYDASVFNSVQGSDNWLAWFNLDTVSYGACNVRPDRRLPRRNATRTSSAS